MVGGNPLVGAISELTITNNGASQITVTANYIGTVFPTGAITINCATTGANGLDSSSLQVSTWYYIWAIYNGTNPAGLASTYNGTNGSPALPTGYTSSRLIGAARTTDSSPPKFKVSSQIGNHFVYDERQSVSTGTTQQLWIAQSCGALIPPGTTRAQFQVTLSGV